MSQFPLVNKPMKNLNMSIAEKKVRKIFFLQRKLKHRLHWSVYQKNIKKLYHCKDHSLKLRTLWVVLILLYRIKWFNNAPSTVRIDSEQYLSKNQCLWTWFFKVRSKKILSDTDFSIWAVMTLSLTPSQKLVLHEMVLSHLNGVPEISCIKLN